MDQLNENEKSELFVLLAFNSFLILRFIPWSHLKELNQEIKVVEMKSYGKLYEVQQIVYQKQLIMGKLNRQK